VLTGKYTRGSGQIDSKRAGSNEGRGRTSEAALEIARTVDAVADELGVSSAQVATAWVMAKRYGNIPIVGARKVSQIEDTLQAAYVELSDEQMKRLDDASAVEPAFPQKFLKSEPVLNLVRSEQRGRIIERP
jgi:aryl-alcohol dehydrogenase-like predicted oxidoreductase